MTQPLPQDMSSQGVPEVAQEQRQDWWFTFGWGQTHPRTGESLKQAYVVINATERDALRSMREAFGDNWAHYYSSAKSAGVEEYGLRQIPLPGASVEERTDQCPTCGSPSTAEHPVVTLDEGGDEDGEVVDRCLNPWHIFSAPKVEVEGRTEEEAQDISALITQYGTLCAEVAVQRDDRLAVEPYDKAMALKRQILDRFEHSGIDAQRQRMGPPSAEGFLGGAAALRADVAKSVLNATADLRELLQSMDLEVDWPASYREALAGLDRIERQVRGEQQ